MGAIEGLDGRRHLINAQTTRLDDLAGFDVRSAGLIEQADNSRQDRQVTGLPGVLDGHRGPVAGAGLIQGLLEGVQLQGVPA
jgi:hypothetical protein